MKTTKKKRKVKNYRLAGQKFDSKEEIIDVYKTPCSKGNKLEQKVYSQ